MPDRNDPMRDSRAILRRVEDAERLVRVEVGLQTVVSEQGKLAAQMVEHTTASAKRQDEVLCAIEKLEQSFDKKIEVIHGRHNALVKKFYLLAGAASTLSATAAKWGAPVIDFFFHGPSAPK